MGIYSTDYLQLYNNLFLYMNELRSRYIYDKSQPLGKPYEENGGIYNACFKAIDIEQNRQVLISQYSSQKYEQIQGLAKRLTQIKTVKHKNLSEIYEIGLFKQDKTMILALQYCDCGSILDYVAKKQDFLDSSIAIRIIADIMEGLKALHAANIIHRSINIENIQIDSEGTAKLTVKCLIFKTFYLSPEQKKDGKKKKENDLFSLGVSLYRLICGITPFKGKVQDQFSSHVKVGPNFNTFPDYKFPLVFPQQIKQIICKLVNSTSQERNQAASLIKKYVQPYNIEPKIINKYTFKEIIGIDCVPIKTMHNSIQKLEITVLNIKEKKIQNYAFWKADKQILDNYVKEILIPFEKNMDPIFVQVSKYKIIDNSILVVKSSYCNQGSLLKYRQADSPFTQQQAEFFLKSLKSSLKLWGHQYKYLSNKSIFIHRGGLKINFPPFPTKQYLSIIKLSKGKVGFIAPQVIEGKNMKKGDSWSVAALYYWMKYDRMPQFIKNQLLLPEDQLITQQQKRQIAQMLEKNPQNRRNLNFNPLVLTGLDLEQHQGEPENPLSTIENSKKRTISPLRKTRKERKNKQLPPLVLEQQAVQSPKKIVQRQIIPASPKKEKKIQKITNNKIDNLKKLKTVPQAPSEITEQNAQQSNKIRTIQQCFCHSFELLPLVQKHYTKPIRIGVKWLIALLLYIFLFYFYFFKINGRLLGERYVYEKTIVKIRAFQYDTIPDINYTLVTKTPYQTQNFFYNKTLNVLRYDYTCVLNNYSVQSDVVGIINKSGFAAYQVFGILIAIFNLFLVCLVLAKFDFPKALSLCQFDQYVYTSLYNFFLVQLGVSSLLTTFYLIYGALFHLQTQPCIQKPRLPALQYIFKNWVDSFAVRFTWIYLGIIIDYAVLIYFVIRPDKKLYIVIYIFLILLYLTGVGLRAMGGFVQGYISVFGVCGEILVLMIGVIFLILDLVWACAISKIDQYLPKQQKNSQHNKTQEVLYEDFQQNIIGEDI